ncbi:erythromycin esterase family protein [Nocardia sp. NPDC052566]|uniref:erythromycin esterase family protein n=1 Tax=Nocardia sp. NPDC052566 TaxID=3364330 RepID=UPI0037CB5C23
MSVQTAVRDIGLDLGDDAALGAAMTRFLGRLDRTPALLALGEPTHGVEQFLQLRNDLLRYLVEYRGYGSIALESSCLSGVLVDEYVTTGIGDLDEVLAKGFSHEWGSWPANRELVTWLRDVNARQLDRVRFYGVDAPTEMDHAPSPRAALLGAHSYLVEHLGADRVPHDAAELSELLGADAPWENPAAMLEPARSIGDSARARALRVAADDVLAVFQTEAPGLRGAGSEIAFERANLFARTAVGLLRYHAAMAADTPDRFGVLCQERDRMMAANLLDIARSAPDRGGCLVFAHNSHLQRHRSSMRMAGQHLHWWSAGALVAAELGDRYVFIGSDTADLAAPQSDSSSLQYLLADATGERGLFPVRPLLTALRAHPGVPAVVPEDFRYAPIDPAQLDGMDAIVSMRVSRD